MIKEQVPTSLNATQTILSSLYQRIMANTIDSPQPKKTKSMLQHRKHDSTLTKVMDLSQSKLHKDSPQADNSHLFGTEPAGMESKTRFPLSEAAREVHCHSSQCCVAMNEELKDQLKKAKKSEFLMQSYKQQVEYLKKLALLQSEQIEKLRRMLRAQEEKKFRDLDVDMAKSIDLDRHEAKQRPTQLRASLKPKEKLKASKKLATAKIQKPEKPEKRQARKA